MSCSLALIIIAGKASAMTMEATCGIGGGLFDAMVAEMRQPATLCGLSGVIDSLSVGLLRRLVRHHGC
jgi:hypothetical protein